MVQGNAVSIREEAKQARNTHLYTFSMRNFTSFKSVNFPGVTFGSLSTKETIHRRLQKLFAHVIMTTPGGVAHKSWYPRGVESFVSSQ